MTESKRIEEVLHEFGIGYQIQSRETRLHCIAEVKKQLDALYSARFEKAIGENYNKDDVGFGSVFCEGYNQAKNEIRKMIGWIILFVGICITDALNRIARAIKDFKKED